jgi:hypothetical protein
MPEKTVFDGDAMIRVLDAQRADRGLDWNGLAEALHQQSSGLNARLADNRLCQGALVRTARRGTMSCQYALIILRWIDRAPEDFLKRNAVHVGDSRLPVAGPDMRLRWELPRLHAALDADRCDHGLTWVALADQLGCTPNRLTNLKAARLADMDLTMRITQHLKRPAAAFVSPAGW